MDEKLQEFTFVAREYQLELLEEIKKCNTILYLPTGSGKTYIATMLIKDFGESLNRPLNEGRKWTVFIVQSVPLVNQQATSLRKHLPWTIGTFSGDMNVDLWSQGHWDNILKRCHIMVMTAQIYLNNLLHGYMKIQDANLIIFDECHHAVSEHPFRKIMQFLHNTNFNGDKCPHVLGLTATLINSNTKNVKEELTKLQKTFNATIKTRYEHNIKIFSARPEEHICLYDEHILNEQLLNITERMIEFTIKLKFFKIPTNIQPIIREDDNIYYHEDHQKTSLNTIKNYFLDIEVHLVDSGVYIAYLATWHYIIEIEKNKKLCCDVTKYTILSLALSEITIIRKMFYDYLIKYDQNIESASALHENSSSKLQNLMKIISGLKRTDSCLVFVDRRTTAKLLYHYIKEYINAYKLYNIECDFIVGARGILNLECREAVYKKKQNNDIIKKFNDQKLNVLVTSEVLEEGVDIQTCNYVIRYDSPKNFPSYVQSKGRARSDGSKFIVLVPNVLNFKKIQNNFVKMEEEIEKILVQDYIDDDNIEDNLEEVFFTKKAKLTLENAISIINRYCFSLPQDRFTNLGPEWYIAENRIDGKKYKLQLPMNSAIKYHINGKFCATKKNAKKSAAFNACVELYNIGSLDEYLLPVNIKCNNVLNNLYWFPHWEEKDSEADMYKIKPGTGKMKRMVHIESPSFLHGAYPQVEEMSYLHVIHCVPKYNQLKDSKYESFDKLLNSNKEFGILTSKVLPHISDFPIFLNFGDVNVHIKVNVEIIYLSKKQHDKLELFHNKLFLDVLGVKEFTIRNYSNEDNSFLIVPIDSSDNAYKLDWNVVDIDKFVETEEPSMEERKSKFYNDYLQTSSIISPWYRNIVPIQRYVVTDVYNDMTPESRFPTCEYDTYQTYFSDKYNIHVANKNQPMIKVKSLGVTKINYLVPRFYNGKIDKRSEYIEILVPEFCIWHNFPSVYWLKALMLPTILYRINKLLLAEDLLIKINSMCNIEVENNSIVDTVEMDKYCGFNEVKKKNIILPISDTLKYLENPHNNIVEWNSINLPIDIERQKNTTMLDVLNYHTFMYAVNKSKSNENTLYNDENETDPDCLKKIEMENILRKVLTELNVLNVTDKEPPILNPLSTEISNRKFGPQQSDILKVITPPFANDMFHYERMETYGDSFLKFACSLVLFDAFELENEGVLTEIKMKMVGNRNLFYTGKNLNIGSYVLVNSFEPTLDWMPPCFSVPRKLKEIIEEGNLQSDVLHQITIPRVDKIAGKLSDETWVEIENEIIKFKKLSEMPMSSDSDEGNEPQVGHSQSDLFINKQSISDKMVADCIESLIGTYVYHRGVEVGFKILHGLGIIPKEFIDTYKPKPIKTMSNELKSIFNYSHILPGYEILERRIGYSFKNKELLIQALTHPTYQLGLFECYQRLEFLGDAILDFLITTYIIEHCNNKTPGEITDIRSSLVNNITFASLSTRIGLHRFILAKSVQLTEAIDRFYEHQQKNNHKIGQEVLYLIEEGNCYAAESIDVPKVLGDLFESLIGAIYIDCDRDLNFVWSICYRFMENEIKEFCNHVPKNPIRILHETKLQPSFSKPAASPEALTRGLGTMIQLDIILNNKTQIIYGFGKNKKEAKVAAAKMALKNMKKMLNVKCS